MHDWGLLTQAERDARYNNSAAVKNSAEYMAAMTAASAERRAASPARLDLPYGPQERNKVDFFPAADAAAPCLVFIHGGYWQRNGREGSTVLADGVRAHGWAAALPGYTLAPEASLTTIVAEIAASLDLDPHPRQRPHHPVRLVRRRPSLRHELRPHRGACRPRHLRRL